MIASSRDWSDRERLTLIIGVLFITTAAFSLLMSVVGPETLTLHVMKA